MHSRDATILIVLLWFNVVHYSSLFQYFYVLYMVPTLVEIPVYLFVNFFWKHYYYDYSGTALLLQVNPCILHTPHAPVISIIVWKEDVLLPAMFDRYTAVWINNYFCNQNSHYENHGRLLLWMEAIMCLPQNWHFLWWVKMNGTQKRALISPWRMFMHRGMAKGTSWAEATLKKSSL